MEICKISIFQGQIYIQIISSSGTIQCLLSFLKSWTLFLFLTIFLEVREICPPPHPGERCSTTFYLTIKSMSSRVILALRVARPLLYQISGPRNMCARTCQWFKPLGFLLTSFCMSCARPIHPISFFYSESLTHSSFLPINLSSALLKA